MINIKDKRISFEFKPSSNMEFPKKHDGPQVIYARPSQTIDNIRGDDMPSWEAIRAGNLGWLSYHKKTWLQFGNLGNLKND